MGGGQDLGKFTEDCRHGSYQNGFDQNTDAGKEPSPFGYGPLRTADLITERAMTFRAHGYINSLDQWRLPNRPPMNSTFLAASAIFLFRLILESIGHQHPRIRASDTVGVFLQKPTPEGVTPPRAKGEPTKVKYSLSDLTIGSGGGVHER
jgi:hypothetical protein